jgi:hypothetical protein
MSPKTAFKMVYTLNLHFTSLSYSILTYGNKTRGIDTKWDNLSALQKMRYEWFSTRFPITQDLVYACIGSIFDSVNLHYGEKEDIMDSFFKFKSRREGISYNIKDNFNKHELTEFINIDKLIFKYFVGEYSPEYLLMITRETNDLVRLYESPNLSWGRGKILALIKYRPFFNPEKYIHLVSAHEYHDL